MICLHPEELAYPSQNTSVWCRSVAIAAENEAGAQGIADQLQLRFLGGALCPIVSFFEVPGQFMAVLRLMHSNHAL